jgi:hypothetical protein
MILDQAEWGKSKIHCPDRRSLRPAVAENEAVAGPTAGRSPGESSTTAWCSTPGWAADRKRPPPAFGNCPAPNACIFVWSDGASMSRLPRGWTTSIGPPTEKGRPTGRKEDSPCWPAQSRTGARLVFFPGRRAWHGPRRRKVRRHQYRRCSDRPSRSQNRRTPSPLAANRWITPRQYRSFAASCDFAIFATLVVSVNSSKAHAFRIPRDARCAGCNGHRAAPILQDRFHGPAVVRPPVNHK